MSSRIDRWEHLNQYERKYLQERMKIYDDILVQNEDIMVIAEKYQLTIEEVKRAKDYAFGEGVVKYRFVPDLDMAMAWQRMAAGQGNPVDEKFLRHEIYESELVKQGLDPQSAHKLAQKGFPWSELL